MVELLIASQVIRVQISLLAPFLGCFQQQKLALHATSVGSIPTTSKWEFSVTAAQYKKTTCLFAGEAKWPGIGLQNQDLRVRISPLAPFWEMF